MGTRKTIAVDFDGVLCQPDAQSTPYPGAREAISLLRENGWVVIIHSCNNSKWIERWMNNQDIRFDYIWDGAGKPVANVYLDDRGLRFENWEQALRDIRSLEG